MHSSSSTLNEHVDAMKGLALKLLTMIAEIPMMSGGLGTQKQNRIGLTKRFHSSTQVGDKIMQQLDFEDDSEIILSTHILQADCTDFSLASTPTVSLGSQAEVKEDGKTPAVNFLPKAVAQAEIPTSTNPMDWVMPSERVTDKQSCFSFCPTVNEPTATEQNVHSRFAQNQIELVSVSPEDAEA